MITRAQRLQAFLHQGASVGFTWGTLDCAMWACSWIEAECGRHPAKHLLGTYTSRHGCARVLVEAGGLEALAGRLAAEAGLEAAAAPAMGDVGLVRISVGDFMAVCAGSKWAIKTVEGVVIAPLQVTRAWTVPEMQHHG